MTDGGRTDRPAAGTMPALLDDPMAALIDLLAQQVVDDYKKERAAGEAAPPPK